MEFIKYQGFNDKFIGLVQDENKYFIVYSKTAPAELSIVEDRQDITYRNAIISSFLASQNYKIKIPLLTSDDNNVIHIISLPNKETYNTLVTILEDLL